MVLLKECFPGWFASNAVLVSEVAKIAILSLRLGDTFVGLANDSRECVLVTVRPDNDSPIETSTEPGGVCSGGPTPIGGFLCSVEEVLGSSSCGIEHGAFVVPWELKLVIESELQGGRGLDDELDSSKTLGLGGTIGFSTW